MKINPLLKEEHSEGRKFNVTLRFIVWDPFFVLNSLK
ncbi:hypothetical protein BC792_101219 [Sphingobacterium allocomposti]|jgi:hypothetical protein|uniref:Uncharacterized protein n=1 Tax=Sphingobacterium allocomposti TaxID=415956 RepID=A0A5S5DUU1_9SPHI|nr:hypothetical protein BC792_101219 [Sphingobacterium composti Yoo et al. 2007 non Ten et al. 2007]